VGSNFSTSSTIHDSKYRDRSTTNRNGELIALSEALRLKSLISKTEHFPTHRKINESKRRIIIINTPTELKGGRNISNLQMIYSKILDGVKKGRRCRHSEKLKNRHRKTTPL
jgi:hypothetical protein